MADDQPLQVDRRYRLDPFWIALATGSMVLLLNLGRSAVLASMDAVAAVLGALAVAYSMRHPFPEQTGAGSP